MKLKLIKFQKVKSTNDEAIKIIKSKSNKEGIVISALQTNGKGTMGKKMDLNKRKLICINFF